jgi:hypothetical protein
MSEAATDRLYELLPAVYRIRDAEHGQPLRALMGVLETELAALEQDVEGLYDNWFIETCEEWVVPYIGDLLKVPGLHAGGVGSFSLRAYVANVLAYRRRKGTATVLEQMAGDVSGWRARVVEFGRLLAATQSLNHVRRAQPAFTSVRDADSLALIGGPFDPTAHSVDVRHVDSARGRHNIPNIGIFLWRLQSYELERVTPCACELDPRTFTVTPLDLGRYTFHPLGISTPLFNNPQPETEITHLAEEVNVPAALRRRPLYRELEARRAALDAGATPKPVYFDSQPPFEIYLDGAELPLPPEQLRICDLSDWDAAGWQPPAPQATETIAALVDPQRGRLVVTAAAVQQVQVSYAYGYSGDIGGGPYDRSDTLAGLFGDVDQIIWWRGVSARSGDDAGPVYATFGDAVRAWRQWSSNNRDQIGVITVMDSDTYVESLTGDEHRIDVHANNHLIIVAAYWRDGELPGVGGSDLDPDKVPQAELSGALVVEGLRPCLRGNVSVKANSSATDAGSAGLHLNGLLIDGQLTVLTGNLGQLDVAHCTIVPGRGGITVNPSSGVTTNNPHLTVRLVRSISGCLLLPEEIGGLFIQDSIVDAVAATGEVRHAVAANAAGDQAGPETRIERSTLRGAVHVRTLLLASDTIFTAAVTATRLQAGCVRYSYLPETSHAPRRFRCQPDLALLQAARMHVTDQYLATVADLPAAEYQSIVRRLRPMFTSLDYGDPGYAQLALLCATELRAGAEDGSEMGAFSHLRQPQREANIRANLAEYLRFGLEAGIFYVN